jgi:ATP-dependent Lon protease
MNPIIYMDEIDKISETSAGQDIMNFLIHITDPEQTSTFEDKYFAGIPIDISKVLFVFSYNDESRVSPILLDRLNIIRIASPSTKEKVVIARDYMIKDICKNVGISKDEVEITENAIRRIISTSDTHGMRDIKRKLETIVMKINTLKLTGGELNFSFNIKPKEITEEILTKCPGKTKLKKMETRKKNIYIVDEDKVSKLLSERDDNTSYKMMFI